MQLGVLLVGLAAILGAGTAAAKDHPVAAGRGNAEALFASGQVRPGDRLILAPGRHGPLGIERLAFAPPVTVTSAPDGRAVFDQVTIIGSSGLRLDGVTVMPDRGTVSDEPLVRVRDSRDIRLERLVVASAPDAAGWSPQQWRQGARDGVWLSGPDIVLADSFIRIVKHGIASIGDGARIENNFVELFSGDGIRGLGDNSVYLGNTVDTCVSVDGNHDDGFQSWSVHPTEGPGKGVVRNVRVENNVFRNGDHPLTCQMQGIGLFDGLYEDWTIRNNTVIVDHWHGITVMGARRVTVIGNTVIDARPGNPGPPWIAVTAHKDGRPPRDSVVTGNVLERDTVGSGGGTFGQPQPGVQVSGNRTGWRP